jgi:hypothetical protein
VVEEIWKREKHTSIKNYMIDYYQNPAISQSRLKAFLNCPFHYEAEYILETFKQDSDSLEFGKAFDCYVTEHDKFASTYHNVARRTGAEGELTNSVYEDVTTLGEYVRSNKVFQKLTSGLTTQREFFADLPSGQKLKAKLDYFGIKRNVGYIVDLKTAKDSPIDKFKWSIFDYGYDFQMAFYKMIVKMQPEFVKLRSFKYFIPVIDRTKQHYFFVYELDKEIVDQQSFRLTDLIRSEPWLKMTHAKVEARKRYKDQVHSCPMGIECPLAQPTKIIKLTKDDLV